MRRCFLLAPASVALGGLLLLSTAPAAGQERARGDERVITVTGQGQVQVVPDTVIVQLGVEQREPTARDAMEKVSRAMQAILERLRRDGIPDRQLRTATIRLNPIYDRPEPTRGATRLIGYHASNVLTVTLTDVGRAGPVLDAGMAAGANQVLGIQFRIANDLPPRLAALKAATEEARSKAQTLVESFGVGLGRLESINESAAVSIPHFEAMAVRAAPGAPIPVEPGEITVRAEVTARYRIEGG